MSGRPAPSPGRRPIVTVDGPAGSGKTTTARAVARRVGFRHLDSGALYRALAYALLESGTPPARWAAVDEVTLAGLGVKVRQGSPDYEVRLGERPLGPELRTEPVTAQTSFLASLPAARACLLGLQREAGRTGGLVADGRDMGTVVFPDADVKVYLVAELTERARRRVRERTGAEPDPREIEAEAERIERRDRADSERTLSPLRQPPDAFVLDTTRLSFEEQVEAVVAQVRRLTRI